VFARSAPIRRANGTGPRSESYPARAELGTGSGGAGRLRRRPGTAARRDRWRVSATRQPVAATRRARFDSRRGLSTIIAAPAAPKRRPALGRGADVPANNAREGI